MDLWMRAFAEAGLDPAFYASRERGEEEIFPWEHIDAGVTKEFLLREWHKSAQCGNDAGLPQRVRKLQAPAAIRGRDV